ncbi:MAG: leucyl aminopeptidase [Proteobacteria bacterium]|nr:leucyl aminopeptidase [Pseudomonadota bacterium]MBI3495808.1 leucyl aminopeptidase [Pseudomonadota bacterium]
MRISFSKLELPVKGAFVVGAYEGKKLAATAQKLDRRTRGALTRAMAASRFTGKAKQTLSILAPSGVRLNRIVILGLGKDPGSAKGKDNAVDEEAVLVRLEALGGALYADLARSGESDVTVALDIEGPEAAHCAVHVAFGARLRSYRFDKYKTKQKPEDRPTLARLTVLVDDFATARKLWPTHERYAESIEFTRDLVSEPGNIIFPKSLAEQCKKLGEVGVAVEVLGIKEMTKLGMGALLGVGQGSAQESQLVVMQWKGADAKTKPIAFVGKGVTFDTGGISIKPAQNMEDMKWDMGGSGTVIGLMRQLAQRKARVNAVGIVGLVENMPSATAQRPGDIVKTMSGQTVEVINTDAEGRLVLADALWYCQDRFKPQFMIDLATLTGAIIISLGHEHAGLFSNDDELADRLIASGKATGETVWRMPLGEAYDKAIDSDAADMKNVGNRAGGSITAAQFIQRFVNKLPWAHLDIAGMAWSSKDKPTVPKGATAFGVRLLDRLVAKYYEAS